ncbi:MAG: DUF4956 domain-containing protein [Bacilli bacterium]|nr:DUF4956 domain-containing protein [Bacilli bacterium]
MFMFNSIFNEATNGIDLVTVSICSLVSIVLGFLIAIVYKKTEKGSKYFLTSITIMPLIVQTIIMLVNGNLGMAVAISGSFSLIRFRSIAGRSKEIITVFLAMTIGVATGMGYVFFAVFITIIALLLIFLINMSNIFEQTEEKILKITIPENLDYTDMFDDIFKKYLDKVSLEQVKTVNMGSLFDLSYNVSLKKNINEKEFIDEIRIRNGNLKVMLSHPIENELL